MKVLVVYASRHGATGGIADRIAQTLERCGLTVTLRPANLAGDVDAHDAYVIGSAAYIGGWLGEARTFVRRNQRLLATRPVWLFSSGPIGTARIDAKGNDVLKTTIPKEFAEFERTIRPRGTRVFFGAYDAHAPASGIAERLMAGFMRVMPATREAMPEGDFRDWPAIEAWAEGIARELGAAPVEAVAGPQ